MTWFGWTLAAVFIVNSFMTVSLIDRPREPLTRGTAMLVLATNALLVLGAATVGTAH